MKRDMLLHVFLARTTGTSQVCSEACCRPVASPSTSLVLAGWGFSTSCQHKLTLKANGVPVNIIYIYMYMYVYMYSALECKQQSFNPSSCLPHAPNTFLAFTVIFLKASSAFSPMCVKITALPQRRRKKYVLIVSYDLIDSTGRLATS